jgi:hypothetical protein
MQTGSPNDVGDGQLLFPSADGNPLGTIRLHNIRDGLEDFGYLALLRQLPGGDAAVQKITAMLSDPTDLQKHVDGGSAGLHLLATQRQAVAAAIEKSARSGAASQG